MLSKKQLLSKARLYLILDTQVNGYDELFDIAKQAIGAGVGIIQLRDKQGLARDILDLSKRLRRLTEQRAIYIVNDRVDLALLSGADGVHLGQEDIALTQARRLMGHEAIIGVSCQTLPQALKAQKEGADYIGFGSVFKTQTKPHRQPMNVRLLKEVVHRIKIPLFAIGGIGLKNLPSVKEFGVKRFAVCRAICKAQDVGMMVNKFK
jgi:thiamine-phosphate diphosphorylase